MLVYQKMSKENRVENQQKSIEKTIEIENGVYSFYKKIGETPLEAINRFRLENKKYKPELDFIPVTYAGRLDPMAEGILILLVGEKTKEKEKYLGLGKTYKFEILWGVETDSLDVLGLVVESGKFKVESEIPNVKKVQEYLDKSVGKFEQMYPAFSSRPVNGKPLFEWAREGKIKDVDIPKHVVEVYCAKHIERKNIPAKDLKEIIFNKIDSVKGDFRQVEIKKEWQKQFDSDTGEFVVDRLEVQVSSGFYVRQFVADLARNFSLTGTTFSIKRLEVKTF